MNNYHVYEEIGKGKYSNVYKGRKKKSIEYVAVKGLEKSRLKKLLNEVKMFSDLNHPNILKFYSWYESRNHLWVILEYCPGGDLMSLIKADSKGLGESTTKQFIRELSSGLMYLHSKGIIYCDLKPSNVLFNEYGNVKISDLGLAKCLVDLITSSEQGPEDISQAQKDMSKRGSPYYMAPELFQDGSVYSFQSDLWAIGCVAYELATGQPPFVSASFTELVSLIINAEVQKVENYSPQFNELIRGLLEKDPTKRWTWERICKHPFFQGSLQSLSIPPQPHYENWCKKYASQRQQERLVSSTPVQQPTTKAHQSPQSVDILRLSLNVKKNLLREEAVPYEKPGAPKATKIEVSRDVKLLDRDMEIDIGSGEEVDDDNEEQGGYYAPQSPNIQKPQGNKENVLPMAFSKVEQQQPIVQSSPMIEGYTPQLKKAINPQSNSQLVPLEQLFTHSSDTTVKPIIGNREIERGGSTHEPVVVKESLPFAFISAEEVNRAIESEHIEQHFENIYNALASSGISLNDKNNVANYFEQIVQTSNTANRLLNSAFTPLLLKLLRQGKSGQLKLRVCCVIGLLLRHATVIDQDVSQMGIVETMVDLLNSKETAQVRRKACAALGEYLFYGATQMDEDSTNTCWEMSAISYNALIRTLKQTNEDEIVKFYSVKTIENITSQSLSTGYKFANNDCVSFLIILFLGAKNDNLKSSCAIAIVNIALLDNKLVDLVLHNLGLTNIVQIFMEATPRIQQAIITIFNLFLIQSLNASADVSPQTTPKAGNQNQIHQVAINTINRLLLEECIKKLQQLQNKARLLPSLVHMLDHAQPVSRGKAALSIMFILKFNVTTLVALSDESLHFYAILDKGLREQNEYFKSCVSHLLAQLNECIPWMINAVSEEIQVLNGNSDQVVDDPFKESKKKATRKVSAVQEQGKLKGNLVYLQVLLQFASIGCLQPSIFNSSYIPALSQLLKQCSSQANGNSTLSQAQHYLFNIVSQMATNSKVLVKQQEAILGMLKPCIDQLGIISATESRFLFLNFIIEISTALLSEESIYDYPGFLKTQASEINKLVTSSLLPQLKQLLGEQPPLPFYALKFVGILLEHNPQFLLAMKKSKIIAGVLDMYKLESSSITGHTLTVVQKVIDGSTLDEIFQMGIIDKTTQIFSQFIQTQQEWSFDDLSSILTSLTSKVISEFSKGKTSQTVNPETTIQPVVFPQELGGFNLDPLLNSIAPALSLLPQASQPTQSNLTLLILHSAYIFSGRLGSLRQSILTTITPIAKQALSALLPSSNSLLTVTNNNIHNYTLLKRSIKAIHWVLILNEQKPFKLDRKEQLTQVLDRIKLSTDDRAFINATKEVPRYLL